MKAYLVFWKDEYVTKVEAADMMEALATCNLDSFHDAWAISEELYREFHLDSARCDGGVYG